MGAPWKLRGFQDLVELRSSDGETIGPQLLALRAGE
jgi:hypothetical protein